MVEAPWSHLPFGEYELGRPVGTGGMGEVWVARHVSTSAQVAIKVLTGFAAKNRIFLSAFRNEIRACAGLDHPSIVRVYDRGEVPAETDEATRSRLQAGSPYLVMEYVGGGSLQPLCGRLSWWETRQTLLRLLDALAHAHARGLIHRDIKPENVLLTADRTEVKLSDFGLAQAMERAAPGNREKGLVGTPRYMAPEQVRGEWRDYGPWTDFYALGCLGYSLVAGKPPFAHLTSHYDLARAQVKEAPPPLEARCPVPHGFERWLLKLMAKSPADRFGRASEAAAALRRLGAPESVSRTSMQRVPALGHLTQETTGPTPDPDDTEDATETDPGMASADLTLLASRADEPMRTLPGESAADATITMEGDFDEADATTTLETIPVPDDWREPDAIVTTPPLLLGAGLGLYWMRSIPMVGRQRERDLLWEAARSVNRDGRARAVLIRGPTGCGKSRLAQWIAERAHEIAGFDSMKADHVAEPGHASGLGSALARHFRVLGLEREQAFARIATLLLRDGIESEDEALALTEVVHPSTDADPDDQRRSMIHLAVGRDQRRVVILRALRRIARKRPLVLWIDDVQDGAESLEIVRAVLSEQWAETTPILVVMTVRPEELRERPEEEELLLDVLGSADIQRIELWPLAPADTRDLVRRLLHLEGELAMQVEERTQGNPLFAMQLVGNWVDRGLLEQGQTGFRLRKGATVEIPDGLHSVWAGRMEQFLTHRSVHDGPALEMAATLGQEVDEDEWWDACDRAGLTPSLDLVDSLLDEYLATSGPGGHRHGWSFVHAMLRESLERRAAEAGRLASQHLACAQMLEARRGPGVLERRGRHLAGAQRPEDALDPLLGGARERLEVGDLRHAEALLHDYERTLHGLRVPWDDARWGRGWLLKVRIAAVQGKEEAFAEWVGRTEEYADVHGWEDVNVELTYEQARRASQTGRLEEAWSMLALVEMAAEARPKLLARTVLEQARVAEARGDRDEAADRYRRATRLFQEQNDGLAAAEALLKLAELDAREGEIASSEEYLQLASDLFTSWGHLGGRARCAELMGLTARLQADFAAAVTFYREACARYRSLGSADVRRAEASLAQALVWNGEYDEAQELLETCLKFFDDRAETPASAVIHAALLPCLAKAGRWTQFDGHLAAARELVKATGYADEDMAWSARLAGQVAGDLEDEDRARACYGLARELFEATGRDEEAAAVARVLERM